MNFDPGNRVIQLCSKGMMLEGEGNMDEAKASFLNAWRESITDLEKFTAAHYLARHQDSLADKLIWDEIALQFALKLKSQM